MKNATLTKDRIRWFQGDPQDMVLTNSPSPKMTAVTPKIASNKYLVKIITRHLSFARCVWELSTSLPKYFE